MTGEVTFYPPTRISMLLSYLRGVVRFVLEVKTTLSLLAAYSSTKYFSPTKVSFHSGIVAFELAFVVFVVFVVGFVVEGFVVVVVTLGGT